MDDPVINELATRFSRTVGAAIAMVIFWTITPTEYAPNWAFAQFVGAAIATLFAPLPASRLTP